MKSIFKTGRSFLCLSYFPLLLNGCSAPTKKHKLYTVEIKDMKFVPEEITVDRGDTVKWINQDMVVHDVTEENSKAWSSGPIQPNGSWKMPVNNEADYYCSIHVVMKGKLKLK